ncbi:hypothetical protein ALC60_00486, partial [Trachymyrmex zeteki]
YAIYYLQFTYIIRHESDVITQAVSQDPRFEASHERAGWAVVRTPPRSRQKKSYLVNPDQRENAEKGDRSGGAKASADSKANAEERTKKAGPFEHR